MLNDLAGKLEAEKTNDDDLTVLNYVTNQMQHIPAGSGKRMTGSLTRLSRLRGPCLLTSVISGPRAAEAA